MTDDLDIRHRISALVSEEHSLREQLSEHTITPSEEHARLKAVETELDQCWDLLRQRDALRAVGQSPEAAQVRSANVVEGYRG
jgi:phage tail sheath gpL-like